MLGGVGHVGVSDMKNAQKIKHALRHFGFGFAAGQRVGVQWMGVVGCRDGGMVGWCLVKLADRSWESWKNK